MEINQVYDNQQKPSTVNQIDQTKPAIPKSIDNYLVGYLGNSMNGGHDKTIAWKQVMAGERHKEYRIGLNMQMLTPLTPAYQTLKCTLRAFFVPNSRVWTGAENFTGQANRQTEEKITVIPNTYGKEIPVVRDSQGNETLLTNTCQWRDSWISSYIPRMYNQHKQPEGYNNDGEMPAMSILPIRGRIAIYNDFLRNKEYDEEWREYKGNEVTDTEWDFLMPKGQEYDENMDFYTGRARRQNSYYTDYRTTLQGLQENAPTGNDFVGNNALLNWASWESKIAEARAQAENAQKNDWEIIAEIRGSKKLSEGKVQLIGERTFNLNYSSITQSSYNSSGAGQAGLSEQFQVMGTQGAYSYTNIDMPLYAGIEFVEEGYIHIIATVTADSVFECGVDRTLLNINALDVYRPEMKDDKLDLLYTIELGISNPQAREAYIGYKRKYSELFKLPNIIAGDMTTEPLYDYKDTEGDLSSEEFGNIVLTNSTYQFFENYANYGYDGLGDGTPKRIWKDYTDTLINKNQAIKSEKIGLINSNDGYTFTYKGQNQIFFVGIHSCICDLPVDDSIKKNYTVYGEH